MKSLRLRNIAGQVKLKGKKEKVLSCKCCVLVDFRHDERCKELDDEIKDFDMVKLKPLDRVVLKEKSEDVIDIVIYSHMVSKTMFLAVNEDTDEIGEYELTDIEEIL
ncbi:MAG TPA: hypothetical protein VFM18_15000 [Methanosarcina sp.]|nr:hypothetical protein [Methanosarcina sp.]